MIPKTEAEMAEAVASATGPLRITGGGTRAVGNPVTGTVLQTTGLSGITLYEPGALTLVAQAGTPLAEIEQALARENQRLAFEPMDHRALLGTTGMPTIGGAIAAGASGPRRISVGAARDHMLGVRFVDGAGTIVKNGGRVMKNVTGYDLVKLMTGSWGTLGVLTEVSLKVLPKPESAASILIDGLSDADAVAAMARALGSPYEITGAAHVPVGVDGTPVTMLRIEGFAQSVDYRAQELQRLFGTHPVRVERDPEAVAKGWRWVRDVEAMQDQPGDVWRISCKPSDGPTLAARLKAGRLLYDWGGGLIWALVPEGHDLRGALGDFDGHATLVRASETTRAALPVFHPENPVMARLAAGLRAKFDPRGILNPGLMAA